MWWWWGDRSEAIGAFCLSKDSDIHDHTPGRSAGLSNNCHGMFCMHVKYGAEGFSCLIFKQPPVRQGLRLSPFYR